MSGGEGSCARDLAAPQGFEPRYADPESAVLPLNEGAVVVRINGAAGQNRILALVRLF